jgi:PPM family protein phosphatase
VNTTAVCPYCGHESIDHEFCDFCNREIVAAPIVIDLPPSSVQLADGRVIDCSFWSESWPASPETFVAVLDGDRKVRVHGVGPIFWPQYREAVEERERVRMAALPPIAIARVSGGAVVVADCWESAAPTGAIRNDTSRDGAQSRVETVVQGCRRLHTAMQELHRDGYVWLNFAPEAIERSEDVVRITNLDLGLFPVGRCPERLPVSPRFSPPEVCRFQSDKIGPSTDVFHLALFAYFSLANILPGGFPGHGLEAFHFEFPPIRVYWPELPVGIWQVLQKGLKTEPKDRYPTTAAFLDDLQQAADHVGQRTQTCSTLERAPRQPRFWRVLRKPLSWLRPAAGNGRLKPAVPPVDLGHRTIAGRAKNDAPNQDAVAIFQLPHGTSALNFAIVADGVSTARLGTGDLASRIACQVIEDIIRREIEGQKAELSWESILSKACLEASEAIVAAAALLPNRPPHLQDNEVMSTTAVVAVLDGDTLNLANVGDSRAYLIRNGVAEQLTVDGDVACSLLRELRPPEEVQDLGIQSKALRNCLGACEDHRNGTLICDRMRSTPQCASWRILSGETVVLCSDGLVEEGVFLEPEELGRIVCAQEAASAQQIADLLVNESNGRQRSQSDAEPSGFGDNIACVVIRFAMMSAAGSSLTGSLQHG